MDFEKLQESVDVIASAIEAAGESAGTSWPVADAIDRASHKLDAIAVALERIADGLFAIADKNV